jgi:tetratricopeptide (TPR) repeat protein
MTPTSRQANDPTFLYSLAVSLEKRGLVNEAIEAYGLAIGRKTDFAEARTSLGILLLDQGRAHEAIGWLRSSRLLQPSNPIIAYNLAIALQREGHLDEAAEAFRSALALKSDFPEALTNLGIVLIALGRFAEAIDSFQSALTWRATDAKAHTNLGVALVKSGRSAEAIAAHRRALALAPLNAEIYANLGESLSSEGLANQAIIAYRTAIVLKPDSAETAYNLGLELKALGRLDEAIASYRAAVRLKPTYAEALNNLGTIYLAQDQPEKASAAFHNALNVAPNYSEAFSNLGISYQAQYLPEKAIKAFRDAVIATPNYPEAYNNLGVILLAEGQSEDSLDACARAIRLNPDYAEAYSNLGNAYYAQGRFNEAVAAVKRALALRPHFPGAQNNLGMASQAAGQPDQALAAYREALALRPDYPAARYNLATALLLTGAYEAGWQDYEWRWKGGVRTLQPRPFEMPVWTGEDLRDRSLLIHGEQGLGDVLQFARYVPLLAERAKGVVFEVLPSLKRLFEKMANNVCVIAMGDPIPPVDFHLSLMSAPHLLKTTVETIPASIPYVVAEPSLSALWEERLSRLKGLKVGLVWAGNHRPHDPSAAAIDRRRSMPLAVMTPLLRLPGISFVSLQMGTPADQLQTIDPALRPQDWMTEIGDFADTAGLVAQLDLVIAVDTSVAHLAGAMGKPVWILSRFDGCWRWLMERDDSPWYPTARLFRQTEPGDWKPVIARVVEELKQLLDRHSRESGNPTATWIPAFAGMTKESDALPSPQPSPTREEGERAEVSFNRGVAFHKEGRLAEASAAYGEALRLKPDFIEALTNLGTALLEQDRLIEAKACQQACLALQPDYPRAHHNLGVVWKAQGLADKTIEACRRAITGETNYPLAHLNLAHALLLSGDFGEGWQEYEWRWTGAVDGLVPPYPAHQRWTGQEIAGKTLLLHAEQGLGDCLQFVRYAALFAQQRASVIVEVPVSLRRLLSGQANISQAVAVGETVPSFDYHLPMMSAPYALKTRLENIPAEIPYTAPDPALASAWGDRLAPLPGVKVGLVWAGDPQSQDFRVIAADRRRSIALSRLTPLLSVSGISVVSLQKGSPRAHLRDLPPVLRPLDWMDEVVDFADTAALIANLDLVITVDTSVAHLAGAMGKPVWILSRFDGCWRWLCERDDSPWYPTARLFRQRTAGDWDAVVERVVGELKHPSSSWPGLSRPSTWTPGSSPGVTTTGSGSQTAPPSPTRGEGGGDDRQDRTFILARAHHQAGQLSEAEMGYRRILETHPDHPDSLHLLGVIAFQMGRNGPAETLISRSIALAPHCVEAHNNLGNVLRGQGKLDAAIEAFRRALRLKAAYPEALTNLGKALQQHRQPDKAEEAFQAVIGLTPNDAHALYCLGVAQQEQGKLAEAERSYRAALALQPIDHQTLNNLGNLLKDQGHYDLAIDALRAALRCQPNYWEAHYNLGVVFHWSGRLEDAVTAYRAALAITPNQPKAWSNLGIALKEQGALTEALSALCQAIDLQPDFAEAYNNLSLTLMMMERPDDAIMTYWSALTCKPDNPEPQNNLGVALFRQGRHQDAVTAFHRAILLKPDYAEARTNLGMVKMTMGDNIAGWRDYEWRWKGGLSNLTPRGFPQPLWDGGELNGRTILLHGEQGFGDILQFVRYAPMVAAKGGPVIIEAYAPLTRLLRSLAGPPQIVATGATLPPFDCHLPLMSLPHVMGTAIGTNPDATPYLHATSADQTLWHQRLSGRPGRKVGLVWAGNPRLHDPKASAIDRRRSIMLFRLAPLLATPGIDFISLQTGDATAQIQGLAPDLRPLDFSADIADFADTAGLIANLDLVISVDTAAVHLAGALGKPVWILSRFDGCWRWQTDREDSPWYPTARLFRQTTPGDWKTVIDRMSICLREWIAEADSIIHT